MLLVVLYVLVVGLSQCCGCFGCQGSDRSLHGGSAEGLYKSLSHNISPFASVAFAVRGVSAACGAR